MGPKGEAAAPPLICWLVNIFLVRLAPWLLIAASFVLLGWGIKKVLLGAASRYWPASAGVVEESIVEEQMFKTEMPRQT